MSRLGSLPLRCTQRRLASERARSVSEWGRMRMDELTPKPAIGPVRPPVTNGAVVDHLPTSHSNVRTAIETATTWAIAVDETLLARLLCQIAQIVVRATRPGFSRIAGAADRPFAAYRIVRIPRAVSIPEASFAHTLRRYDPGARVRVGAHEWAGVRASARVRGVHTESVSQKGPVGIPRQSSSLLHPMHSS